MLSHTKTCLLDMYHTERSFTNIQCVNTFLYTTVHSEMLQFFLQLGGYTLYRPLVRHRGLCIYVNSSWCTISKEVSKFSSPEVEYLMISCRPHYLPRECSSVFFVAVYIPPQTNADTKTSLNELHTAISKQENAHPEAVIQVAGDFNAGKLKSVLPNFYQHVKCATRGKKSTPPLLHTQTHTKLSLALHLSNLTITLSS